MGWIRHHGIVVTSWDSGLIERAHKAATEHLLCVTEISAGGVNGYRSFLVPPDGSKEGWEESNAGDSARDRYIGWLNSQAYKDGSSSLSWIEYEHDSDNHEACILRFTGST